jgi:hypothetical protein
LGMVMSYDYSGNWWLLPKLGYIYNNGFGAKKWSIFINWGNMI